MLASTTWCSAWLGSILSQRLHWCVALNSLINSLFNSCWRDRVYDDWIVIWLLIDNAFYFMLCLTWGGWMFEETIFSVEANATSLQIPRALWSSVVKVGCDMFAPQLINGRWTCLVIGRSWGSWHVSLKFIALPARSWTCQIQMTLHDMVQPSLHWLIHSQQKRI